MNALPSIAWSKWMRQVHRWLSIIFTMTVIANFVAMGLGKPPAWIVYSPLPPLFLMLLTGLYMFVLPYASAWRGGKRSSGEDTRDDTATRKVGSTI